VRAGAVASGLVVVAGLLSDACGDGCRQGRGRDCFAGTVLVNCGRQACISEDGRQTLNGNMFFPTSATVIRTSVDLPSRNSLQVYLSAWSRDPAAVPPSNAVESVSLGGLPGVVEEIWPSGDTTSEERRWLFRFPPPGISPTTLEIRLRGAPSLIHAYLTILIVDPAYECRVCEV